MKHKFSLVLVLTSMIFYFVFAYSLIRTDHTKLIGLYLGLFVLCYKLIQTHKNNIQFLSYIAFGFRAIFIVATPNLSQDFYRFIWDGRMILEGFNPYLYTVESFISNAKFPVAQSQELYQGMGTFNANHYSNYPPVNQFFFVISGLFGSDTILGTVLSMRFLIIAADLGTLYFGKKLLQCLGLPSYHILWYILNPFIIIELTGNLHFEGVMLFFLTWSLYLIHKGRWQWAAVVFALSITVKLIPLLFLPLFYQYFIKNNTRLQHATNDAENTPKKKPTPSITKPCTPLKIKLTGWLQLSGFYGIVFLVTLLLFVPFFSIQFANNYTKTLALWFQNFEFNASIYYVIREIGYLFRGNNEIAIIGKYTAIIVCFSVIILAFFRKNNTMVQLISAMLIALSLYYFTATTVHPWYIATLLLLSVFTNYKFPLIWSVVIILSYLSYTQSNTINKHENLWIIGLEYFIVYIAFFKDLFKLKSRERQH